MSHNIYLVERTDNSIVITHNSLLYVTQNKFDCDYSQFIVVCDTEYEARTTHPRTNCTYKSEYKSWMMDNGKFLIDADWGWIKGENINDLEVTHIGTALPGIDTGVLISSFNAG